MMSIGASRSCLFAALAMLSSTAAGQSSYNAKEVKAFEILISCPTFIDIQEAISSRSSGLGELSMGVKLAMRKLEVFSTEELQRLARWIFIATVKNTSEQEVWLKLERPALLRTNPSLGEIYLREESIKRARRAVTDLVWAEQFLFVILPEDRSDSLLKNPSAFALSVIDDKGLPEINLKFIRGVTHIDRLDLSAFYLDFLNFSSTCRRRATW